MARKSTKLLIKKIKTDPRYYPRFQIDQGRVKEFAEAMEYGEYFPPLKVARDPKTGLYILLDGKHRLEAHILRGEIEILVDIFPIQEVHWLMAAARFNSKSSKPLHPDEIKKIIIESWRNGIKDTCEIAQEMGRTVRYVEMVIKPTRDEERNKRKEKILELHRQGMSQRQIASEVGFALSAINKSLTLNADGQKDTFQKPKEIISGASNESPEVDKVFSKRNDFVLRTPHENIHINELDSSPEKSGHDSETAAPIIPTKCEFDGSGDNETLKNQIGFVSGGPKESPETNQVFYKRNDFVYRTPDENNNISELDNFSEKSGHNCETATPISPMKQEPDESVNDESILNPNEIISGAPDESPATDQVFSKRNDFVLRTPEENNDISELDIPTPKTTPDCQKMHSQNSTQTDSSPGNDDPHKNTDHTKKTTPYPSYLDQIDFYRELPIQGQHAIRAMELAKKYKMDIINMVNEINEPVIWIRKVLVAAMALSLMHGEKLNDASSVETLLGISFDVARCIQNALPFQTMLCPISPDMEQWAKDNLSANDLDLILSLVDVDKNDLPHLLKGETPPKKTNCFEKLPDSYKEQLLASIAVLRELRDHARNKRFNGGSAKQLLVHLNKNVTVINEIFDGLRDGKLL